MYQANRRLLPRMAVQGNAFFPGVCPSQQQKRRQGPAGFLFPQAASKIGCF